MVREIDITEECLEFIDNQNERVSLKFFQLIEVIGEIKIINSNCLKKLQSTQFYELRINAGNEYRFVLHATDNRSFAECTKAVCLCGFQKKEQKITKRPLKKRKVYYKTI